MLILKVLSTDDPTLTGEIKVNHPFLSLGASLKNSLPLKGSHLPLFHSLIFLKEKQYFISTLGDNILFINEKRFKGTRILKVDDKIQIGAHQFQITESQINDQDINITTEEFHSSYNQTLKENPDLESIFEQLENELIYIESKINESEF